MKRAKVLATSALAALIGVALVRYLALDDEPRIAASTREAGNFASALLHLGEPRTDVERAASKHGEVELCDYGHIEVRDTFNLPRQVAHDAQVALRRAADELIARGNDAERAFGLKLRTDVAAIAVSSDVRLRHQDCSYGTACAVQSIAAFRTAAAPWVDSLARLASTTRDASAYVRALKACEKIGGANVVPACASISVERWTQLEPDNAAPWLYAMADAERRKDASALEYAAFRVSTARTSDTRWGADFAVMQSQAVQEQPRYTQIALASNLIGIAAAVPSPPYLALLNFCNAEPWRDNNRKQLCGDIATALVERDRSLMGTIVGAGIGERAGWPAERIAAFKEEREAIYAVTLPLESEHMFSCESFEKTSRWWNSIAQLGEVNAARAAVKASGKTTAELALQYRANSHRIRDKTRALQAADEPNIVVPLNAPAAK